MTTGVSDQVEIFIWVAGTQVGEVSNVSVRARRFCRATLPGDQRQSPAANGRSRAAAAARFAWGNTKTLAEDPRGREKRVSRQSVCLRLAPD
jgi:hypothetical protein